MFDDLDIKTNISLDREVIFKLNKIGILDMVNAHLEKEALFGIDSSSINDIVKNNDIDIVVCENIDDIENPSLIYNKLTDNIPNNAVVSLIVNSNITIKSIYNILNEIED